MILNDKKIKKELIKINDHHGYAYGDLILEFLENCEEKEGEYRRLLATIL